MRSDSDTFTNKNLQSSRKPYYVIALSWDTANSDITYLTSSEFADYPSGADVLLGVIKSISGTSQKIDPINARASIGAITFSAIDVGLTAKIRTKLVAGDGLRRKRVQIYVGYDGLAWSDYRLVQTQIIDSISVKDTLYTFKCSDVQRFKRKKIFSLETTNIAVTIPAFAISSLTVAATSATTLTLDDTDLFSSAGTVLIGTTEHTYASKSSTQLLTLSPSVTAVVNSRVEEIDLTVSVASVSGFETKVQGDSYTDGTGLTCGYFIIDDEVFRYEGKATGTPNTFTSVRRARLSTQALVHEYDSNSPSDRQPEVVEYVYIEEPALKIAYKILVGSYGGVSYPSNWHLNINAAQYIDTTAFESHPDIWDTSDDEAGIVLRFEGLEEQDGKKFLEEEIYLLLGAFSPVTTTGELSFQPSAAVLTDSSYVKVLDETNIVSYSALSHDMKDMANVVTIAWNYNRANDAFSRTSVQIDQDSIDTHGVVEDFRTLKFRGLHGSLSTASDLARLFDGIRDRYSGPPIKLQLTCLGSTNQLEVGDVVLVDLSNMPDYAGTGSLNRSMEVQSVGVDWITGDVKLSLFGSSQRAAFLSASVEALDETFNDSAGTRIDATNMSGFYDAGTNTLTGYTFTGNADMNNSNAIYYHGSGDTDLILDGCIFEDNVQIRCFGEVTFKNNCTGKGGGLAGAAGGVAGSAGYVGYGLSGGGLALRYEQKFFGPGDYHWNTYSAKISTAPTRKLSALTLKYNGTTISGIPSDLRGTSGSGGAQGRYRLDQILSGWTTTYLTGGAGGASGAGLCVIAKGVIHQPSSDIDLSGADGTAATDTNKVAGTGGGGEPGFFLFIANGTVANIIDSSKLTLKSGASPNRWGFAEPAGPAGHTSGKGAVNVDAHRNAAIQPNTTAVADTITHSSVPAALNISYSTTTTGAVGGQADGYFQIGILTDDLPTESNYLYSNIYWKKTANTEWTLLGKLFSNEELSYWPADKSDGTSYDFKAHPVSNILEGHRTDQTISSRSYYYTHTHVVESDEFVTKNNQIADSTISTVILTAGSKIETNATASTGITFEPTGIKVYDDNNDLTFEIISETGGTDGDVLIKTSGNVDSGSGDESGVVISTTGIKAYDSSGNTLTTVSDADGKLTAIAGTFKTSSTVGDGSTAGVVMDDGGVKLYNASSTTPTVHLDASDGSATFQGDISGSHIQGSSFTTSGSYLTAAATAADTTLYLNDVSSFAAGGGSGWIVGSTTSNDYITWGGTDTGNNTLTSCTAVLANPAGSLVVFGPAMLISNASQEIQIYGDSGTGQTNDFLVSLGVRPGESADSILYLGGSSSGYTREAIAAYSYSNRAIHAQSNTSYGLYAVSTTSYSIVAKTEGATLSPLVLTPAISSSDPTHAATKGAFWVTGDTVAELWFCTGGSTWVKIV